MLTIWFLIWNIVRPHKQQLARIWITFQGEKKKCFCVQWWVKICMMLSLSLTLFLSHSPPDIYTLVDFVAQTELSLMCDGISMIHHTHTLNRMALWCQCFVFLWNCLLQNTCATRFHISFARSVNEYNSSYCACRKHVANYLIMMTHLKTPQR